MMAAGIDRVGFLDSGIASRTLAGESLSGDAHLLCATRAGALAAVVDGLGHGADAAAAAQRAVALLREYADEPLIPLVRRCHQALLHTRGVALSLAAFNTTDETLTWLAVGNVEAVLLRGDTRAAPAQESVVMRGGVVGSRLPLLQASVTTVVKGDVLVLATDGIRPGFAERLDVSLPAQQLADHILAGFGRATDDALVLVVRHAGTRLRA